MNNIIEKYSKPLGKNIKFNKDTGAVSVQEIIKSTNTVKTINYSKEECDIIKREFGEITKSVHLVKSIFNGEIVKKNK